MDNFNHIKHAPLRIYNRAVMASNILEDHGVEPLREYVSQFTEQERLDMFNLLKLVRRDGVDTVRKMVTAGMKLQEDDV